MNEIAGTPRGLTQLPAADNIEEGNVDVLIEKSHQEIQNIRQSIHEIRSEGDEASRPKAT